MDNRRTFYLRKMHSLAGIIPLGIFLCFHMVLNSFALISPEAYNKVISGMQGLPYLVVIELVMIFIPLLFHGIYGIWITWTAKSNVLQYTYYRNWMYYLQRVAGIVTFIFVIYHIYSLRLKSLFLGQELSFSQMGMEIQNPGMFIFYIVGILFSFYHFANGIFTFSISNGITVGRNSQRVANIVCWSIFFAISIVGLNALVAFR